MTWVDDVLRTEPLARRAPSVLNTQPVVLRRGENFVEVGWDPARTLSVLDPRHDQLWLALGAFVEAMLIAGAAAGLGVRVEPALDEARHRFALLHSGPVVRPPFDADDLRNRVTGSDGSPSPGPASPRSSTSPTGPHFRRTPG